MWRYWTGEISAWKDEIRGAEVHNFMKEQNDPLVQQVDILVFTFGLNGVINRSWGFQPRSFTSQNMNALALTVPKIQEVVKSLYPLFHKISAAITV